ncbi:MAG: membrane protein insertase YidC [Pikeienuella sp.]
MTDQKNMILAAVLSLIVIIGWGQFFAPEPPVQEPVESAVDAGTDGVATASVTGGGVDETVEPVEQATEALRIAIETTTLSGSLSTRGGRFDDLHLTDYRVSLDPASDTVIQLSPTNSKTPYYVIWGWLDRTRTGIKAPTASTIWTVEAGEKLTPETPITLAWDNGNGLVFRRHVSVDEKFMFSIRQSVENKTDGAVELAPYSYIARRTLPELENFFILHEGAIGAFNGASHDRSYGDFEDLTPDENGRMVEAFRVDGGGYLGFTDKYWMTTLIATGENFAARYKFRGSEANPEYRTELVAPNVTIEPGATASFESNLFSGAKEFDTLAAYQDEMGIDRFEESIDWGWFYFLTKPIFKLLLWVKGFIGNMGWSIIVLTLIIKAALFPLAYKSYVSMSKMKKLQPEMEKIKERVGDDRQKMQQEMMALYKREKANPAAGCLPILLQIPIFFSLYKVLFVTIEMRQAPFMWWIEDLAAADPTSFMNLFGLMPWNAPDPNSFVAIFSIGVFPILMGVTMWMQQKLNPTPTDKMQAQIFAIMPWAFMFMLGRFASGLVIYWCANNILTFAQQYSIMRSQGVDVDFFGNIKKSFQRSKKS